MDRGGAPKDLRSVRVQGFAREVLDVCVFNHGRSPITVARYSVRLVGGDLSLTPVADAMGLSLPSRLEAGESETWYARMSDVNGLVTSCREALRKRSKGAYMSIELGTGGTVRTKAVLRVWD